jgi:hypothetical protein
LQGMRIQAKLLTTHHQILVIEKAVIVMVGI